MGDFKRFGGDAAVRTVAVLGLFAFVVGVQGGASKQPAEPVNEYAGFVQPAIKKYCLDCHSTKAKKGSLDLERFTSLDHVRKDIKPWQQMIEQLETGEMPPKGKPQPTADERKRLIAWTRGFLDAEARARAGDPGHVPLRRLSNAEYNYTIRDLTGVDLQPTREFPADGAAGEGFTNAAEALSDISPALLTKYLNAAKDIADHAVLLPDGFRFSLSKTRRDWTDEGTAKLRQFYNALVNSEGRLPVQPYLAASVRHREALLAGKMSVAEVAAKENLNPKYFGVLWNTLTDKTASEPLDAIRAKWRAAAEKDVPALVAEITVWQTALWRTVKVGNYVQASWNAASGYTESLTRAVPVDPQVLDSVPIKLAVKPTPGQSEAVLYLAAREFGKAGPIVWQRPRFEAPGKPTLLLRDYPQFGPAFEIDYPTLFVDTAKYLAAALEAARQPRLLLDDLAKKHNLDAAYLRRWVAVLDLESLLKGSDSNSTQAVALELLSEKTPANNARPAINGWRKKGTDLPVLVTNWSDKVEHIPGRVSAHGVAVHPMPKEFVAVTWKSPIKGEVKVTARIAHAHPACGNGVAYWLEHRRGDRAAILTEGNVDLGKEATSPVKSIQVEKGEVIMLAVDARDGSHVCDMTEIAFTITENGKPGRAWDLAADIAKNVHDGNPHADKHGNTDTWSFVRGASKGGAKTDPLIPADSLLGRWRLAVADPKQQADISKLAEQTAALLSGPRGRLSTNPDRALYDKLVAMESPLFTGVDIARLGKRSATRFGLPKEKFTDADLVAASNAVIEIKLPAALFIGREFVVDAKLDGNAGDRLVRVRGGVAPGADATRLAVERWDGPLLGSANAAAYKKIVAGHAEFRKVFPLFICFPQVVPTDEVVTLKMFHREDEPLIRMFLTDEQTRKLDRLWAEHRFVSRQPVAEYDYLPQFMGYTTQDTPKAFQQFFIDRKPLFKKHADEFLKEEEAAIPKQLDALLKFAGRAYRRPVKEKEKADLRALYKSIRDKGVTHEEAFRGVLARVLVSPAYLFRIEQAPAGQEPRPVNDWELATRLSYFLWSSAPDDELRKLASDSKLRDPKVLATQVQRMIKDDRLRALAIEFGTQWLHVRGFDEFNEKNEKLFPTFDAKLRKAIYEESILFFQDLFQSDRPVTAILSADYTFLNETLAKHYGIPGVSGEQWRRVEGESVRKNGRGGILGLASVQAKQAGASRTSPVLRGNWVVETLLGEKLPRPPANVPRLPEEEGGADKLTMRQQVEKHASVQSCAVCHQRIDPYGFALERFDAIGRRRDKDFGGLAIDSLAKLKDGTEFDGIDGLRNYLLTKKKDVIVRLFARKLLGYALGRSVTLSDTALLDEMAAELNKSDGRVSAAVLVIVWSPQFRMIRGSDFVE